ncbi:hypothetical protein KP78_06190 [Jeotgalibacillus soli]|uniref:Uncharacterized protein n=1 Tax=Jeotgalibacillus soli TaxID=889306 RepID=A0A0C2W3I1_9BACL|nr:hypothetical protein KP78_06190 [Jeotgalibacillus soli]
MVWSKKKNIYSVFLFYFLLAIDDFRGWIDKREIALIKNNASLTSAFILCFPR